jgi:hypothetical protein
MKKLRFLMSFILIVVFTISLGAAPVLAGPNTKVDLVEDVGQLGDDYDMEGPVVGFVNTNQDDDGNLRVVIKVKDATPLTTYTIYLVGGPTHATATGFTVIGYLTTNEVGNGNSANIWIDAATMAVAPYGNGPHHIDIDDGGDNKWFVAGPIPYTIP